MSRILIIYHSLSGNTERMARAYAEGARSVPGTDVVLKKAFDATLEDLLDCDGVAFGSADYFSYISGALKDFLDRTFYPSQGRVTTKPYGAFATGGGGGDKVLGVLERLCGSFKLKKAVAGVSAAGAPSAEVLSECREAGRKLATAVSR